MPWLNPKDKTVCSVIDVWFETVIGEVEDIRGWREDPGERFWHEEWVRPPKLEGQSAFLYGYVSNHLPNISPAPIQEICEIVLSWHRDHTAENIPSQEQVDDLFRRVWFIVEAVRQGIQSRVTDRPPEDDREALPVPLKLVTIEEVAARVHLQTKSMTPYVREWGEPEIPSSGRRKAKFSEKRILPVLERQFPVEYGKE